MKQNVVQSFDRARKGLEQIQFSLPSSNGAEGCQEFVRVRISDLYALAEARILLRQSGSYPIDLGYRCIVTSQAGVALLHEHGIATAPADFLDCKQARSKVAAEDLGPDWVRSLQVPPRHA